MYVAKVDIARVSVVTLVVVVVVVVVRVRRSIVVQSGAALPNPDIITYLFHLKLNNTKKNQRKKRRKQ